MQNLTTTRPGATPPAGTCTIGTRPSWCSTEHDGDSETRYAHTTLNSKPVEVRGEDGEPSVLFVDIEQNECDREPYIVIHGPHVDHPDYTFDEAARFGAALLARVVEGAGTLPPEVWAELALIVAKGVK